MPITLEGLLQITNETLTAAIGIMAASVLLYNLSRNLNSPVARASSVLLATVTVVAVIDVFVALNPSASSMEAWLRAQWVGIAFAPAAMFHLSDALLATTGLVSRGRRRRVVRQLYILSGLFLILAAFTDVLVQGMSWIPAPRLHAGPVQPLYILYLVIATIVSVYNLVRARQRCLTTYTHRRMGYLLYSFALPAFGIFPYSILFSSVSQSSTLLFWIMVNVNNLGLALMLLFMAYPLSFFGSSIPDRVVKAELLRFFLRGPAAGILVLVTILYVPRAGRILGLPGEQFMLFAAVALVMFWQWMVSLFLPYIERWIVYPDEQEQARVLQLISQRLLTRSDLLQLYEAILAAVCDLLQIPVGFIVSVDGAQFRVAEVVGGWEPDSEWNGGGPLLQQLQAAAPERESIVVWQDFWVIPLHSQHVIEDNADEGAGSTLLGALVVEARSPEVDLTEDEWQVLDVLIKQAAQALDDQLLQNELFETLEHLLPEMEAVQELRNVARYGDFPALVLGQSFASREIHAEFVNSVRDALRDYWGGPRLTNSKLLDLNAVQQALEENDNSPTRALRAVLLEAVNRLRPSGDRSMTQAEWTLYNIVELRFIQGYKVRDVAKRLAISEADLYRKQRAAIEEVARALKRIDEEVESQS